MSIKHRFWRRMTALGAAAAMMGVATITSPAQAVTVNVPISPEGDGAFQEMESLTWNVGNVLWNDAVPAAEGDDFDTFYQAALATFNPAEGQSFSAEGFEWTIVAGFREQIASATDTTGDGFNDVISSSLADDGTNFLEIYYDASQDHDNLAGTGFNNGQLVLSAEVTSLSGIFQAETNPDGTPVTELFDQREDDDYDGQQTVVGEGSTTLEADLTFWDPEFFDFADVSDMVFTFFNTSRVLPFTTVNPSAQFWDGDSFVATELGEVNGIDGPDFQFQADANQSFEVEVTQEPVDGIIPEPMTATLGLLGLGALGIASRRRRTA